MKRLLGVDIIRILAMLMVVVLHTILSFTLRVDFFATKTWFILEPFIAFSKIGVLLFFMISGYLVINKNRSIKENWQITKNKILFPLVFFSLIDLAYKLYRFSLLEKSLFIFWKEQLLNITNFPNSPLWFLVVLLFLYILNPIWQLLFTKDRDPKPAIYLTKLSLIFSIVVTIIKFLSKDHVVFFNGFTVWLGYLFFYFYGGLVRNNWLSVNNFKTNLLMMATGLSLTMIGDYYTAFTKANSIKFIFSGYFFEYLSIPIILSAIGTFNLLISSDFGWLTNKVTKVIRVFAGLSYGVYLIHPFITSVFTDILGFDFDKLAMNVYIYNFLNYFLVLSISAIISYFILKIPKLRIIIGGRS
ncbi:MAG: acyltransferase family protein [Patescibacteria group bacterium]